MERLICVLSVLLLVVGCDKGDGEAQEEESGAEAAVTTPAGSESAAAKGEASTENPVSPPAAQPREQRPSRAEQHEAACNAGDMAACFELGRLHASGFSGATRDENRAAELYRQACAAEHAEACHELGRSIERGLGGAPDRAGAAELYEQACNLGSGDACYDLAQLYDMGLGVREDEDRALELIELGCERGSAHACLYRQQLRRRWE